MYINKLLSLSILHVYIYKRKNDLGSSLYIFRENSGAFRFHEMLFLFT